MVYLLLLALNYAIMPRLSKKYIHPSTNKQSVALVEEVVKMSLGMGGWVLSSMATASSSSDTTTNDQSITTTMSILSQQLQHWSPLSTLVAAGLPSALYALQGILTYTAYQNLDAVTFNGLTQFKVLSSALCCYIVLGKRQSFVQIASLGMLMLSTIVFQGNWREWFVRWKEGAPLSSSSSTNMRQSSSISNWNRQGNNNVYRNKHRFFFGVVPCLGATLLSGLAGAFSQKSLQTQVASMERDAYFYTVEISFLSAVCLGISMGLERWKSNKREDGFTTTKSSNNHDPSNHFFHHWTYATLLPIITKATAGLLTALVHRHLGSVIKGFALVLGLVFSALLQFALEGVDLTGGQVAGTALVLLSSWLHLTSPMK